MKTAGFTLTLLTMLTLFSGLKAATHKVGIVSENENSIRVRMDLYEFHTQQINIAGKDYVELSLPQEGSTTQKGMPQIPYISRSFKIPAKAHVSVRVLSIEAEEVSMAVAPSKGIIFRNQEPDKIAYGFDAFYQGDQSYPQELAELSEPFILRDLRGITLYLYPFVYNPKQESLRIIRSLELLLELEYDDSKLGTNWLSREPDSLTQEFISIYDNLFLNFQPTRYAQVNEHGKLLVISHNNYIGAIQPYVDWKRQKGLETELVNMSSIGSTETQLKNYVQNYYNQNPGLVFVQLVGDSQHIPTATYGWQGTFGASDPSLSLVAGSDQYPDIFIGRFSCESVADLETQIMRSISYERDMSADSAWIQYATGIASNEGGNGGQGDNGESDELHMNTIRNRLLNYGYLGVDKLYDSTGASAAQVISALNSGRGYLNYTGHGLTDRWGTTSFNNNNVASLNNQHKLPFIVSVSCLNGNFTGNNCFAEVWLRARVANNPTGALAFYGSSISQPWNPPMRAQDEIVYLLTNNRKNTIGGLFYNGSCRMIEVYGTTNGGVVTFRTWHIFGDASLQVRTQTPMAMTPVYNQSVPLDDTNFTVNTGVSGALVSLSYQNQIYGKGYANSSGIATFAISLPSALVQMTLTVTAFNRVTHLGSVQVVPSNQAYLLVDEFIYLDSNNGLPDIGEQGGFDIILKNIGSVGATDIEMNISSTHPGVSFLESTANLLSLAASAQQLISHAFSFELPATSTDQGVIPFIVIIQSPQGTWSTAGSLQINAPNLQFAALAINDATGNNNGRLDPRERVIISQIIQNTGSHVAPGGTLSLASNNPYLNVVQGTAILPPLLIGQSVSLYFELAVSGETPPGSVQEIVFELSAGGYCLQHIVALNVGLIIEDFESCNFAIFPWQFGGNLPWQISSANAYAGSYSARSGPIAHNQSSVLELTLNVLENGTVSFWRKVSSDPYYDKLNFYIDDNLMGNWHGEAIWSQFSYPVSAGMNTFKWVYSKDVAISSGEDCVWIDNIIFPHSVPVANYNPPGNLTTVQNGMSALLGWTHPISGIPTTYQIFRNAEQIHQTTGAVLSWRDEAVNAGATYQYKIKAVFDNGISDFSNSATLSILIPGQLLTNKATLSKAVEINGIHSLALQLSNPGQLDLNWTASIVEKKREDGCKNMTGSWMNAEPATFTPGSVSTFLLSLKNMSTDGEYVRGASLSLAPGFQFQSATAFVGGSSGNLVFSGLSSDERVLIWQIDDPASWGVITPGETATATITVFVQASVTGDQQFVYGITGDEFGAPPNTVTGSIPLENQSGYWVSLSSEGGSIAPNGESELLILVNSHVVEDGIYDYDLVINSNDPFLPQKIIPLKLRVYNNLDWLVVQNPGISISAQCLVLRWDPLWEADAYLIEYSDDNTEFYQLDTIWDANTALYPITNDRGYYRIKALLDEQ